MKFVVLVLGLKNKKNVLALDRTNWKFGKKHMNILTLGVNVKGMAIPLVWISLGRARNAKTADRIELLKKVIKELEIKSLTNEDKLNSKRKKSESNSWTLKEKYF